MNFIEHLFINLKFENNDSDFSVFYSNLEQEMANFKSIYQFKFKSIYIATSDFVLFSDQQLISLLSLINQFISNELMEYSFEIGYDTLSLNQLVILNNFKINRLIWKVRTFNKKILLNLNANFNSKSLIKLIKASYNLNFLNFSIDLEDNIFNQTEEDIIDDLKISLALKAPHISYQSNNDNYNYQNKKLIATFLKQYHYVNYEFFSFAIDNQSYSQQTIAYLKLKNWIGFGPNASSFFKNDSQKIIIDNDDKLSWVKKVRKVNQKLYCQLLITQGLMLKEGIFLKKEQLAAIKNLKAPILRLINSGYLELKNNHLLTTNKGWVLLNDILIDIISNKSLKKEEKIWNLMSKN